jgi:hypothetical protein
VQILEIVKELVYFVFFAQTYFTTLAFVLHSTIFSLARTHHSIVIDIPVYLNRVLIIALGVKIDYSFGLEIYFCRRITEDRCIAANKQVTELLGTTCRKDYLHC